MRTSTPSTQLPAAGTYPIGGHPMKPKTLITLSVAVGCGLVAALMMKQAGSSAPVQVEPTVPVLTVLQEIPTGTRITPDKVKFKDVPKSLVPEGAITSADQYDQRAVSSAAWPGEILTVDRLGEKGVYGQSITIEPGYRVVGVPVDASNSFSGMLQPGDRVDILVTYKVEYVMPNREKVAQTKTKTLLEYVKVFATDNRTVDKGGDQYEADSTAQVHLSLTPEQATWVKLAQQKGSLSLIWRSELDTELASVDTVEEGLLDELNGAVNGIGDAPRYEEENPYADDEDMELADAEDEEGGTFEEEGFGAFLDNIAAETATAEAAPQVWTMQVFSGTNPEFVDVPMPTPVREAPSAEEQSGQWNSGDDKPSAIGTSASVLRQFLLGF